jgi:hypothetical protein
MTYFLSFIAGVDIIASSIAILTLTFVEIVALLIAFFIAFDCYNTVDFLFKTPVLTESIQVSLRMSNLYIWYASSDSIHYSTPGDNPVSMSFNHFCGFNCSESDEKSAKFFAIVGLWFGWIDTSENSIKVDRLSLDDIVSFWTEIKGQLLWFNLQIIITCFTDTCDIKSSIQICTGI